MIKSLLTGLVVSRCKQQLLVHSGEREGQRLVANMGHTISNHFSNTEVYLVSVSGLLTL